MKEATKIMLLCLLGFLVVAFLGACKSEQKTEAGTAKVRAEKLPESEKFEDEMMTLETLRPIFGEARDDNSGIYDAVSNDNELSLSYRFYTREVSDIDDDIGLELAPKIEQLYTKFRTPDRVVFGIYVSHPETPGQWKPYCSFVVTREIIKKSEWTTLLAKDFFKFVLDLKYTE